MKNIARSLTERLDQGILLVVEGYIFELERRGYIKAGPFVLTRFEMAEFALTAKKMGIDYIGICCGAGPHHVRAMAEALGRTVPASEYSPDISLHPIFGDASSQKQNFWECLYGLKLQD